MDFRVWLGYLIHKNHSDILLCLFKNYLIITRKTEVYVQRQTYVIPGQHYTSEDG